MLDRGKRSKIGMRSFIQGGFLIDLGMKNKFFPIFKQVKFPNEWKILLIQNKNKGLYGAKEEKAFNTYLVQTPEIRTVKKKIRNARPNQIVISDKN